MKDVSADEEVRRTYQAILDKENDIESNLVNSMKVVRAEGRAEGEKIGEARGIEKGKEEERAKAYKEKLETAKKFLAMGVSIEQISQASGLSIEELRKLMS